MFYKIPKLRIFQQIKWTYRSGQLKVITRLIMKNLNYLLTALVLLTILTAKAQLANGPLQTYYSNDFNANTGIAVLSGAATHTNSVVQLTPNMTSKLGGLTVRSSNINSDKYRVSFTSGIRCRWT